MIDSRIIDGEVWFVTGSQSMYGQDTLDQVASQSRDIAERLDGCTEIPVRIVWVPTVVSADNIAAVIRQANDSAQCVGVIAWMHTFSPAKMWIRGLRALQKPMLHLHTQFGVELPWDSIDMDFMNLNQAAHGDREFGYIQTRLSTPRKTVAGHVSDQRTRSRIGAWTRAALATAELRNVAVTEGDKVEAEAHFGASVNTYPVNELADLVERVPAAEVDKLIREYEHAYRLAPELRPGGDRHSSLRHGAQIEAGLRKFLETGGFLAFTTNFEDLGGLRQLPGLAVQRLMADGYGFGAEGDWKTAVMLRAVKVMAEGLPGGTSFMEDYTYDLTAGAERVLGAHMLEVCPSIADGVPSLEVHPLSIGGREDPVRLRFTAAPDDAVILGISDVGSRFRLVANEVRVVEPTAPLPNLPVACAVWEPRPTWSVAAEAWLMAGAPHHTVLTTAVGVETIEDFATMTGTELLVIDADTTVRGFIRELKWNDVYHHAAAGL
jgi:L-arabinose isomerase